MGPTQQGLVPVTFGRGNTVDGTSSWDLLDGFDAIVTSITASCPTAYGVLGLVVEDDSGLALVSWELGGAATASPQQLHQTGLWPIADGDGPLKVVCSAAGVAYSVDGYYAQPTAALILTPPV